MDAGVEVFDSGPGYGQAVIGGCAASDFVEQDQRARRRGVQNRRGFGHLDHEGRAASGQVVAGANAREDAVDDSEARGACRDEGAHLRHDHDQRGLAQIRALAAHVGAGQDDDVMRFRV